MPKNPARKKAARAYVATHGVAYVEGLRATARTDTVATLNHVTIGDQVRFTPDQGTRWWTVRARDERFVVATRQAHFQPKGTLVYTVVDLTGWNSTYNGVGPGVVRSSLNTLGGGWSIGADGSGCDAILEGLQAGTWSLSPRRVLRVEGVEARK